MRKKKIIVRAPALSLSGYGLQARFALRALRKYENNFDIYLLNIPWGETGWIHEDDEERRWIDQLIFKTNQYLGSGKKDFDVSLQITIPNEFEKMAPVNIGYTAGIETNRIAPQWVEKSNMMDRIIVVSDHAKQGFENTVYQSTNPQTGQTFQVRCNVPVTFVSFPVYDYEPKQLDLSQITTKFNFLCVAQYGPRKNLDATIDWFVEEFIDNPEVGLVLKVTIKNNSVLDRYNLEKNLQEQLEKYPQRKCKIYLLHGDLSNEELMGFYQNEKINALINISYGECFGLPMFEAAYNELPVITVGWGGQCDYLYMPVKEKNKPKAMFAKVDFDVKKVHQSALWEGVIHKDSSWAYAQQGSYKMRLRDVYKNYGRYKSWAKELNKYIRENFSMEVKYKQFVEAVLGREVQEVSLKEIPRISIITSVFNAKEQLSGFLQDIKKQTIFDSRCELILIHPFESKDFEEEKKIIDEFAKTCHNLKYVNPNKPDNGVYSAWNVGCRLASGEYLTNANVDDRKRIDSLEYHARELFLNPDIDLVYADSFITDKPNEVFEKNSSGGRAYNFPQFSYDNMLLVNAPHQCPMWRKSIHEKHGYFDENNYKSAGDWEMWLRIAQKGSKFLKINEILGLYYFNPVGISTNPENNTWKQVEEQKVYSIYKDLKVEASNIGE